MNVPLLPRPRVAKAPSILLAPCFLQVKKIDRAIGSLYYNCVLMSSQSQLPLWTLGTIPQSSLLPIQKSFLFENHIEHLIFLIPVHHCPQCGFVCKRLLIFISCNWYLANLLTKFIREKKQTGLSVHILQNIY